MAEMTDTTDTSTEAAKAQSLAFAVTSLIERISKVCRLSSNPRTMARDAIRRNHPEFDSKQVELKLMALAICFDQIIQDGAVEDQGEIARLGHVTPARL